MAMNKIDFEKKINENPFKSITNILYEIILNDIINFDLIPNTKINEAQIAELFNVSRTPLRDALQLLINQGFLIKIINKGTFVAPFDSDDYFKLSKFRVQLESLAAGYAAEEITDKEITQLYKYAKNIEKAYASSVYEEIFNAENEFHYYIIQLSKNNYIMQSYDLIKDKIKRYHVYITANPQIYDYSIKGHYAICEAMKFRQREMAELAMQKHLSPIASYKKESFDEATLSIIKNKLKKLENMK